MMCRGQRLREANWCRRGRWWRATPTASPGSSSSDRTSAGSVNLIGRDPLTSARSRFSVGTVMLVTRLCDLHMEWLLDDGQVAAVSEVASLLLAAGEPCAAPRVDADSVYDGLLIDLDPSVGLVGPLPALEGIAFGQLPNGMWLRVGSGVPEEVAFTAAAATPLGPALDWVRTADRSRAAFWADGTGRSYAPCPEPHWAHVELVY
jgi:hypothetical protein